MLNLLIGSNNVEWLKNNKDVLLPQLANARAAHQQNIQQQQQQQQVQYQPAHTYKQHPQTSNTIVAHQPAVISRSVIPMFHPKLFDRYDEPTNEFTLFTYKEHVFHAIQTVARINKEPEFVKDVIAETADTLRLIESTKIDKGHEILVLRRDLDAHAHHASNGNILTLDAAQNVRMFEALFKAITALRPQSVYFFRSHVPIHTIHWAKLEPRSANSAIDFLHLHVVPTSIYTMSPSDIPLDEVIRTLYKEL
jgi:hypothetical protein